MATNPKSSGVNNLASIIGTNNENITCKKLRNADHLRLLNIFEFRFSLFNYNKYRTRLNNQLDAIYFNLFFLYFNFIK